MAKKAAAKATAASPRLKSSALVDTWVVYCGDNLEQLQKLPDACVDLIYIDPPFNSKLKEKNARPHPGLNSCDGE